MKQSAIYYRRLSFEPLESRQLLAAVAVQSGNWNDPNTWDNGVPDAETRAIITQDMAVTLDGTDHVAGEIVVHGVLNVPEDANAKTLTADWIHVNSGGVFQIGTEIDRFDTSTFVLTLTGVDPEADHVIQTATGTMNVNDNDGFLMTAMGGRLQFYGNEKVSFTKLAATAQSGSNTITVENVIERNFDGTTSAASDGELKWSVGDQIVIASSSYDYADEEVRTIIGVQETVVGVDILILDKPLKHRHYGEVETYGNGVRTWDIDMRAEVALLSRSITIQGTQDTDSSFGDQVLYGTGPGKNLGIGAQTVVMPGSGQITVDGVRFDKGGQTGRLGRYPIHWHEAGDRTGDILRNSSVTNSNNRGVTIHGTQNVLLEGNVLHDIHGHGFFMEDASETGNQFLNNIAFGIHRVGGGTGSIFTSDDPFVVPGITRGADGKVNGVASRGGNGESSHDTGQNVPNRFLHSAAYWINNPDNTWVGNVSAGSEGTGFWFALPDSVIGHSKDTGLYNNLNPRRTNLRQFDHNTSHSAPIGLNFDRGADIMPGSSNSYAPAQTMRINDLTAYKHSGTAVYHRASFGIFNETRFADNAHSSFNTFQQEEHNILFVGHSRGNADPNTIVGGFRLYDGPGRIMNSHFGGFAATNAHMFRVEGGASKHAHTRAEGITFENDGSADHLSIEYITNAVLGTDKSPTFVAGRPDSFTGIVLDVDGSLTGHAGGGVNHVLVPKLDFYRDSTDVAPPGWNAYISDDRFAQFKIGVVGNNNPANLLHNRGVDGQFIPAFRIENGDGHAIVADRWNLTYVQRMYTKLNAGDYTVRFLYDVPETGFDVMLQINSGGQPGDYGIFRFVDVGWNYKPSVGREVDSLGSLRSSQQTAFFRDLEGDLWIKFVASGTGSPTPLSIPIDRTDALVVSNTNDSGSGSLRDAIMRANANLGLDTIAFDVGTGIQTIRPQTALPAISDPLIIDGSSQTAVAINHTGFESPVQPDNTWEKAHGVGAGTLNGSAWTFIGGGGITRNLSAFQNQGIPAPIGQQHALIQGAGSLRQDASGFEPGHQYELSLLTMARQHAQKGSNLRVILDAGLSTEQVLLDIDEVTFKQFTRVTGTLFEASKPSYTISIIADGNGGALLGDRTTFVDEVEIRLVGTNLIVIDGTSVRTGEGLRLNAQGYLSDLTINNFSVGAGILISGGGTGSVIDHVMLGVTADGRLAAPNRWGMRVAAQFNEVRDSVISGNLSDGIKIGGDTAGDNLFVNNRIGTDVFGLGPIPNGSDGIQIVESSRNTIGPGNVIAYNTHDGVMIVGNDSVANRTTQNTIFGNTQLGIDLGNGGVTPNDALDADGGANDLTNFPVLLVAFPSGSTTTIVGEMNGLPNTDYTVEFFSNGQADPTGYGQGRTFLGTVTVTTNAAGTVMFDAVIAVAVPVGEFVTATATDSSAGTSEFSQTVRVTPGRNNATPTLNAIDNLTISEDGGQMVIVTGISAGGNESQSLRLTAVSNNPALIPHPLVTYASPDAAGTLYLIPLPDQSGTATITVTVEDAGLDGNLGTPNDNATFSRTFNVTVTPVNDQPTLNAINNLTISEGAGQQTVGVTGISAGGNESQSLRLTAVSNNPALIPHPLVTYASPDAAGTLYLIPLPDQSGTATITVTVEDAGLDGNLGTPNDNATFSRTFNVEVTSLFPWHNTANPLDINDDGATSPIDAVVAINELNSNGSYPLPKPRSATGAPYYDVSKDGWVSALDPLQIINHLNETVEQVVFSFDITDVNDEILSQVEVGDHFYVSMYTQDTRATAHGVYAAYLDLYYDTRLVTPIGAPVNAIPFTNGSAASFTMAGVVDEWGVYADVNPTGSGRLLVSTIQFKALAAGTNLFGSDSADIIPLHDVLVYGATDTVKPSSIEYIASELLILEAAEGEYSGEGEDFFTRDGLQLLSNDSYLSDELEDTLDLLLGTTSD
jgi:hypothetical protein